MFDGTLISGMRGSIWYFSALERTYIKNAIIVFTNSVILDNYIPLIDYMESTVDAVRVT